MSETATYTNNDMAKAYGMGFRAGAALVALVSLFIAILVWTALA